MKLEKMGIRGTALEWFRNYLRNRKQKVDINGTLSDEKGIEISTVYCRAVSWDPSYFYAILTTCTL
jgi:hypothetical protein